MKPLVIEEEAELELVGSIAFYEERKAGLGLDFETARFEASRHGLPCSVFATDYTDFHRSITLG